MLLNEKHFEQEKTKQENKISHNISKKLFSNKELFHGEKRYVRLLIWREFGGLKPILILSGRECSPGLRGYILKHSFQNVASKLLLSLTW